MRTTLDTSTKAARRARSSAARAVRGSHTVPIDGDAGATIAALRRLDLAAPALRALAAFGLEDRVVPRPGGATLWPDEDAGPIELDVDLHVVDTAFGSSLTIHVGLQAADERAREALLDAWPVLGPLGEALLRRAGRTVKDTVEGADL
jgi:hypothetical protein